MKVISLLVSVRVSTFGMSDRYQRLLDRCVEVFAADDRVVALFAVGSVGRGTADASSDLDLVVALVDQAAAEDVCAGWETLIDEITPTVYRRLLGTQIGTVVTPSWERLDITFLPAAATGLLDSGPATVVFDHGQTQPPMPPAAPVASAEDLVLRAENFIRSVGLMVTDLQRAEYTTLRWASEFLIQELIEVMFIEVGTARRTLKRIYADLPQEDQEILEGLPVADGTPDSIVACHLATAAEFLPRARALIENVGGRWPEELFDATDRYLRTSVGVGFKRGRLTG